MGKPKFKGVEVTQRELAKASGVHRNTLNKHIDDLIKAFKDKGIDWMNLPDDDDDEEVHS